MMELKRVSKVMMYRLLRVVLIQKQISHSVEMMKLRVLRLIHIQWD